MNPKEIMKIFEDTAYVRVGGTAEELRCALYLKERCAEMGLEAVIETFPTQMTNMMAEKFYADGVEIPGKAYLCCGNADVEAPLYYLRNNDPYSLSQCAGKIVMVDKRMGYWKYQDVRENGALGFITYDSHVNYKDNDIDRRELRRQVHNGNKIPGVNIHVTDAIAMVEKDVKNVRIVVEQEEYEGESRNVILDLPGEIDEYIVFTAHYDSTSLSQGAYDNMSGSIGLLAIAEHFSKNPHRYGMRFVWCGSEERGLLGSKAYCDAHEEALKKVALNINLDMIGCIMGRLAACCTTEEALVSYIKYLGLEKGLSVHTYQEVYSSDSTPFADKGVPAVSFARWAPDNTGTIHNSYDTMKLMKGEQMAADIDFITSFADRMANAVKLPVARMIPDNVKEKLDYYLTRKRKPE